MIAVSARSAEANQFFIFSPPFSYLGRLIPQLDEPQNMKVFIIAFFLAFLLLCSQTEAADKPNIILVFADDISARELPLYGSSVWSPPTGGDTSDVAVRAQTPALDRMAEEGCWVETAWASVVCSPSRAMMMTGRYAHLHKWWSNKDKGRYRDANGKAVTWPLYESSSRLIGHVAQQAGYATYWAGKTQMAGDIHQLPCWRARVGT
jgi:arylsulfatase A-like enzyme